MHPPFSAAPVDASLLLRLLITRLCVAPASAHKLHLLLELLEFTSRLVVGDRNYHSPKIKEELAKSITVELVAPYSSMKRDLSPNRSVLLSRFSYRIDTSGKQPASQSPLSRRGFLTQPSERQPTSAISDAPPLKPAHRVSCHLPRTTTSSASPPRAERTTTLERAPVEKTRPKETRSRITSEETTVSSAPLLPSQLLRRRRRAESQTDAGRQSQPTVNVDCCILCENTKGLVPRVRRCAHDRIPGRLYSGMVGSAAWNKSVSA